MNTPIIYDIGDHYNGDGLQPFEMSLSYGNGNPVVLTGCRIDMDLRDSLGNTAYRFSTELDGDNRLEVTSENTFRFPRILEWDIKATQYEYDVQVTGTDGYVRTYVRGKWKVNQDITR